jgi:hypothetical protein
MNIHSHTHKTRNAAVSLEYFIIATMNEQKFNIHGAHRRRCSLVANNLGRCEDVRCPVHDSEEVIAKRTRFKKTKKQKNSHWTHGTCATIVNAEDHATIALCAKIVL